jgi:hypothetical protein
LTGHTFFGRKWLFREILEHFTSDLPSSGGMIIQGAQATGKSSIILRLVQGSSLCTALTTPTPGHLKKFQRLLKKSYNFMGHPLFLVFKKVYFCNFWGLFKKY